MSATRIKADIVIIGAGFAGITLVKRLQKRLPPSRQVLLVSEESYITFNPLLPEAVSATIFPEQVIAPVREVIDLNRGGRFVMARVKAIDPDVRTVTCLSLAHELVIDYGELVLAFGTRARIDFLPGLAEFASPLKTVGDAMDIRNRILRRLARIEIEDDPAKRASLGHFVIIGGGFSGVEVAGEVVDCIHAIRRYYPRVEPDLLKVTLIHDLDRLLPELPSPMGEEAMRSLKKRKVDVLLGPVRAAAVDARGVTLSDGRYIPSHTVICTVGTRPNALALGLGLPLERGRIRTQADMRVEQREHIWALGDCAWVPNAATPGEVAPPTAQFAVRQGVQLADNLRAAMEGRPTAPFRHKSLGMMAAVGRLDGVAMIGKWHLSGFSAWVLWRAYYLSQMPTTGRKVRIALEWFWGTFFPPDITHLRFTRSRDSSPE